MKLALRRASLDAALVQVAPVTRPLAIEAAGATHVGRQREHNEDCFVVDLDLGLFLVADGIGGAASGEVASRMAVDIVRTCCLEGDTEITQPMGFDEQVEPVEMRFLSFLWRANERIFEAGRRDPRHRGMATTFAGVLVADDHVYIAHVGDSRVYRYRGGRLQRLTEDHSLWNEYARRGDVLPEEVDPLLARSVVTRALGMERSIEIESRVERPEPGDLLLLCSDGLSGPVSEVEIAEILGRAGDLEEATQALVDRANYHGGPDNVTCVLVRWRA